MPRVVVVDDVARVRTLARALAEGVGCEVVGEADDGPAGVQLCAELEPDIVVMDWQMPTMSGIEATRHITEQAPTVHVIAYTSTDDPLVFEAFRDAGALAWASKSDVEQFLGALSDAANAARLKHRSSREPAPDTRKPP